MNGDVRIESDGGSMNPAEVGEMIRMRPDGWVDLGNLEQLVAVQRQWNGIEALFKERVCRTLGTEEPRRMGVEKE
jgi:hypothetical protein